MAKKRPHRSKPRPGGRAASLGLRRLEGERGWALKHPTCAVERLDDLQEVRQMIDAGETEIATDELRWLLSGCPDFIAAHALLGELAASEGEHGPSDVGLARGHFGYAYELGEKALRAAGCQGPLPGAEAANAAWHDAAMGLAWCLEKLGESAKADEVAAAVRRLDPTDPAGVASMLDDLRSGGSPLVELGGW